MSHIVAVAASPLSPAHGALAAGALAKVAALMGHTFEVEAPGAGAAHSALTPGQIDAADVVLLAVDARIDLVRFADKPHYETTTGRAIVDTRAVLDEALRLVRRDAPEVSPSPTESAVEPRVELPVRAHKRLVAVTACPTGIAHTFMAARALDKAAALLGCSIKVETQGSVGAKNILTQQDVASADAVIVAADTKVDLARFAGKPLLVIGTKAALRDGRAAIEAALVAPSSSALGVESTPDGAASLRSSARSSAYKHLMTGVSYMLPLVVAGGLCTALSFAIGGIDAATQTDTLAAALHAIGAATLSLFVAVLSGFIAFSIADRPGLAPGLVGGLVAQGLGAGFLGGIAAGFLAGQLTHLLARRIRLPESFEGLKPVLILPFLATLGVGLLMIFVVAPPLSWLNQALSSALSDLKGQSALALGALLGGMVAFDLGGPVNKAAYAFAVGLLANQLYTPMAAVMAAGMTPAIGCALAVLLRRRRFDTDERRASGPALLLGLSFVTEGAIPFAARDPLRVLPALVLGSAVTGAICLASGATLLVPHGGIFAALVPGAVGQLGAFLLAIVAGSLVSAVLLLSFQRQPITSTQLAR